MAEFLVGLSLAYLLGCFVLARQYLRPMRHVPIQPKGLEEVAIPDGGHLPDPAWCTPALKSGRGSAVVFVFAHG